MPENYEVGQNLKKFEKALKEYYLKAWRNMLSVDPSPLLAAISKPKLVSDKIVAGAPIGLSGGFGFGEEGQPTPQSGPVPFERFETRAKDMYVDVVISQKAVALANTGGAMADALATEVKAAYEAAKWNVGRTLFMNGTGKLTTTSAVSPAGNTITVASTKYLKQGLIIDIYATGGTSPQTGGKARRIVAVDRANKTITIDGDATAFDAGFITVQNSLNREITGLGAIYDDDITTLYGITKSTHPWIYPVVHDGDGDISDSIITAALREAKNEKSSKVDMLLCGDAAYDNYVEYLRVNNIRVEDMSKTVTGGFKAIKFIFGNSEVDILNDSFVPDDEMWGVEKGTLEFHSFDWNFAQLQGDSIFNLMENTSNYRALLYNYGNLICSNPGGCVRIKNCA